MIDKPPITSSVIIEVGKAILPHMRNDITHIELGTAAHDACAAVWRAWEPAPDPRDATIAELQKQLEEQSASAKANSELVDHIEEEIDKLRAENDRLEQQAVAYRGEINTLEREIADRVETLAAKNAQLFALLEEAAPIVDVAQLDPLASSDWCKKVSDLFARITAALAGGTDER